MKKGLLALLFLLFVGIGTSQAQSVTLIIQWDANPVADAVIQYTVSVVGTGGTTIPPQTLSATTACNVTPCQATFTNVVVGNYNASVTATNEWGAGPAGIGMLVIQVPVQVKNVKGKKG